MKYSFILPCRNEEKTIGICINKIKKVMKQLNESSYEIIVSDSSTDKSPGIAEQLNAKLIRHNQFGYGRAYLEAFKKAKGEFLILADADDTYDLLELPKLLSYTKDYDLILGQRKFLRKGSMPFLNKYLGNPLLSAILRLFFKTKIKDAHTGFRIIKNSSIKKLNLKTTGMEFASEMLIKALRSNLKIKEVPINYYPRKGRTKLRRFPDGWRHLRFMLMYAPTYLFIIPGLFLFLAGAVIMLRFLISPMEIFNLTFYNRPMIVGSFLTILGYQIISLGLYTKTYMKSTGFIKSDRFVDLIARFINLERGILIGLIILLISFLIGFNVFINWINQGFPNLTGNSMLLVLTLAIIGIQTIFSAFFLSILLIKRK